MNRFDSLLLVICFLFCFQANSQNSALVDTGDILLFALPTGALATTFILGDTKGSWQFAKGLLLTEAITYGLKLSVYKSRPDGSDENSFPSGHTSTVFHSASFIHRRYGVAYSIPLYALAGLTGISRIYGEKHDGLDVLVGALIGIGSNYLFTTPYQQEHMQLTFSSDNNNYMMGFKYKF